jgi:hypothetical protein
MEISSRSHYLAWTLGPDTDIPAFRPRVTLSFEIVILPHTRIHAFLPIYMLHFKQIIELDTVRDIAMIAINFSSPARRK